MTDAQAEGMDRYTEAALGYCEAVLAGEIPANRLVRLACKRHLDDLSNPREGFPYVYDCEPAAAACARIEELPHIEGEWAARGERIRLEPWQCFLVTALFGWRMAATGRRRYRTAHWEVARKNAKTTLAAAIAVVLLEADGEAGAQVYSAATKRDQAAIVFDLAREMIMRCKAEGREWAEKITVHKHSVFVTETASRFRPLDAQGKRQDGLNVHACINDELHAWEKRKLYDTIETGMGARTQPIMLNITTAGDNLGGIGYEIHGYAVRVLEGSLEDDTFFAAIWTIDPEDNPWDPANWPKANPNWNVSVYPLDMERLARKAQAVPGQQSAFLAKRLNVWVNASAAWMNMVLWNKQGDASLRIEDFAGAECWAGVDLASKRDLSVLALLFKDQEAGRTHWYVFARHYLPEYAVLNSPNAGHYDGWVRSGHLIVTPGNRLDVDRIEQDTLEASRLYRLREVAFDPGHNSTQFGVHIAQAGITAVEVRPTVLNFSDPMKWWEAYVLDGTFHHAADPCLTWQVSNVCVKKDVKDNIFPRKDADDRKIDAPVAIIMALNRAMAGDAPWSVYDTRGVVTV